MSSDSIEELRRPWPYLQPRVPVVWIAQSATTIGSSGGSGRGGAIFGHDFKLLRRCGSALASPEFEILLPRLSFEASA